MSSNIKEVTVALTPADEEALSRPTRRRRGTRKAAGAQEGGQSPSVAPIVEKDAVATATPAPQAPQTPPNAQVPDIPVVLTQKPVLLTEAQIAAAQAPTAAPVVQTGAGLKAPVKIQTRKRTHGLPTGGMIAQGTRRTMLGARILPVKRHAAPAAKPKLIVPVGITKKAAEKTIEAPNTKPEVVPTPLIATATAPVSTTRHVKKRRFAERRLTLSVKNEAKTRKRQKSVKRQVAAMAAEDIRKTLRGAGILKPKSNPPESMLRSMMQDYLALKH